MAGRFRSLHPLLLLLLLLLLQQRRASAADAAPPPPPAAVVNAAVSWPDADWPGEMGSLPLGNGDVAAQCWVERETGDLLLYGPYFLSHSPTPQHKLSLPGTSERRVAIPLP